ncbi:tRNA (adenosine(37)-N6)-threonylcarbamoyltransferase complex ATPase subunit type 1 TsaE [Opitutaceae bacterium EW11]|nr:tRNA (adenosine(37)-N6)-threonylcarbamoyltransferase complex ATPase subunit type 1 TsaE [Opitutaceae bacterium EW11]
MSIFAELEAGIVATSAEQTRAVARRLGQALPQNATLALHGNLGVGKTTFVQGLAEGLGIREAVTSPTFNIFTLHRGAGRILVHLDAYRLENAQQVEDLMLDDFLVPPYWLAVEWPEKIAEWLPVDAVHLRLSIVSAGVHRIALERRPGLF